MMNAAQNRLRMVCRNIAHNGMCELMKGIYKLVREYGEAPLEVLTKDGTIQINPKELPPRSHMEVHVAISPSEKSERAQKLISMKQLITADPQLAPLFGLEQDRNLTSEIFDLMGVKDVHKYLMPLEQLPPPQPNPMEQLQMAMAQAQVENVQAQTHKTMAGITNEEHRLTFEQQKAADDTQQKNLELQFKQEQAADQMSLANRSEDNSNALEQAKHNLAMMQQQVRKYEAALKGLEIQMGAQLENRKISQSEVSHAHSIEKDIAELQLKDRIQSHAESVARETVKDMKISNNKPSKSAGSKK